MATNTNKLTLQAITDMARSVQTYVTGQLYFSGLHDTPENYQDGYFLKSSTTGIEYSQVVKNVTELPAEVIDGQLLSWDCKLYIGCGGEWQELQGSASTEPEPLPEGTDAPGCVSTVAELALYQEYKDQFVADNLNQSIEAALLGSEDPNTNIHDVCLYSTDPKSMVTIDDTGYKWGMFNGDQNITIRALPADSNTTFSYWQGDGVNFGNNSVSVTDVLIDQSASITGVFRSVNPFDLANYDSNNAERILTDEVATDHNFGTAVALHGNMLVATTFEQSETDKYGRKALSAGVGERTYEGNKVGETYIRQHLYTFIYNPDTQLWDQVGKQELTKTYSDYLCNASINRTNTWNEYAIETMKLVGDTLFCGMTTHNQSIRTDVRGNEPAECHGTDTGSTWQTHRAGAVKILKWSNGSWVEHQTLQHPTTGALDPRGVQYTADDALYVDNMLRYSGFGHCIDVREDKLLVVPERWPWSGVWAQYTGKILIYTKNINNNWELTDTIYADAPAKDDYFGVLSCFGANKNQIITRNDNGNELAIYEKQNDGTWMEVMSQPFSINLGNYDDHNKAQELFFVDGSLYVKYSMQTSHRLYKVDTSGSTWTLGDYIELPANDQLDNGGSIADRWTVRSVSIDGDVIASSAITDNNIFLRAGTVYINRL